MEKLSVSKSKIPIVRQTKSSILLCNHNNLNNMNNYSFNNSADVRNSSPKISEDENSEIKVRKRWKSVVNSLCQSQGPMLQTLCCRNCPGPVPQNVFSSHYGHLALISRMFAIYLETSCQCLAKIKTSQIMDS